MPNIASLINTYNKRKIKDKPHRAPPKCNCRSKNACLLQGKCQQECVVYQVKIYKDKLSNTNENPKVYIGFTQNSIKTWYYNHLSSFNNERDKRNTMLSTYVWKIKHDYNKDAILKWEILKKYHKYKAGNESCLCREKLTIILYKEPNNLQNLKSWVSVDRKHWLKE